MAKNNEGDESGQRDWSWAEQITNHNNPYRPNGAKKYYRKKAELADDNIGVYYCDSCHRCFEVIANAHSHTYSSDFLEDFPSYKKPRRNCTICAPPGEYTWGCFGGQTGPRRKK